MTEVSGLPPVRRPPLPNRWWPGAIAAMGTPGQAVLVAEQVPRSLINSARQLVTWPPEVEEAGRIVVNSRNQTDVGGQVHADLYFTFIPDTAQEG